MKTILSVIVVILIVIILLYLYLKGNSMTFISTKKKDGKYTYRFRLTLMNGMVIEHLLYSDYPNYHGNVIGYHRFFRTRNKTLYFTVSEKNYQIPLNTILSSEMVRIDRQEDNAY
ncbi:hypothetical protein BN3660_02243 [Eubacteriaceae bacterium CHKCI004]|nr:hypothetical protein BN3660_02243 [Eubacteriaceae bacterium CHKCI004]